SYGGLGYAIPGVVAGWYADRSNRPIGLFGDGSLGMSAGDLETVVRLGIPAILLHFNNATFGWIDAHTTVVRGLQAKPLRFDRSDCVGMATSYGFMGLAVHSPQQLEAALDKAFSHDGPVFLDVRVRTCAEEIPPVYTWLKRRGLDPLAVGGARLEADAAGEPLKRTA
ncbi:MAG: thiamine pyrophosphate-dependent enzyme, partial [Rhodospirillaceae bacterium]|nr:thiamine pyrophosphate-dependent enzyme [Rhodospirillaceae bacterium]